MWGKEWKEGGWTWRNAEPLLLSAGAETRALQDNSKDKSKESDKTALFLRASEPWIITEFIISNY